MLQKKFFILLLALVFVCAVPFVSLAAEKAITVVLDGKQVSLTADPVIEDGRTLVPFRSIFEAIGLTVGWDADTKTVTGTKDGKSIKLVIGNKTAVVDGENKTLDVAPAIKDGATLVPLRFVAEASGLNVQWDSVARQVYIATPQSEPVVDTPSTGGTATTEPADSTDTEDADTEEPDEEEDDDEESVG